MMKKRIVTGILSAVMTIIMCIGAVMTAFAVEGDETDSTAAITKNLEMDSNVTTPDATFTFHFEKVSLDDVTTEDAKNSMPEINDQTTSFASTDNGTNTDGVKTVTKNTNNVVPSGESFPHAGVYRYHITEKNSGYTNDDTTSMIWSLAEYNMDVYVANKADGSLYVKNVVVYSTKDNMGEALDTKVDSMLFTNKFMKTSSLSVKKIISGDYADMSKKFNFKLILNNSKMANDTSYSGTITRNDGTTETVNFTVGTEASFMLGNGETLELANLPVGTRYSVGEENEGYKVSIETIVNGQKVTGGANGAVQNDVLVGEGKNSTTYTNTKETTVPTGIIVNNLPFFLMVLVAVSGFVAYIAVRRQRMNK